MRVARILALLGLTRIAFITLLGYFLYCLLLQRYLPGGEALLHTPFDDSLINGICTLLILLILYALSQEFKRPRMLVGDPGYWHGAMKFMVVGSLYLTFFYSFGFTKSLIPVLNPYHLDPLLQKIEIALHGGVFPMEWLLNHSPAWFIDMVGYAYFVAWFNVMVVYLLWQLGRPASAERTRFLSSYVLIWIFGGTVLATLLSSVGPIYYSLYYHDAFATMNDTQMAIIAQHFSRLNNSMYPEIHDMLIGFTRDDTVTHINGMSAMPSMHNATMMLYSIHSYRTTRWLRWLVIPFACLIFIGSVLLGWHYAIDAYVSAVLVGLIWWFTGRELGLNRSPNSTITAP